MSVFSVLCLRSTVPFWFPLMEFSDSHILSESAEFIGLIMQAAHLPKHHNNELDFSISGVHFSILLMCSWFDSASQLTHSRRTSLFRTKCFCSWEVVDFCVVNKRSVCVGNKWLNWRRWRDLTNYFWRRLREFTPDLMKNNFSVCGKKVYI